MKGEVIIYWDYELQKGADLVKGNWGEDDYLQTEWLLDQLKKYNFPCCFAVLGYAAEKGTLPYHAPEQVKRMVKEGHEVASHSYTHRELTKLKEKDIIWELKKSKEVLEKLIKKPVITFVPPRNKPFNFFGFSVNGEKKPFPWILPSQLKIKRLCQLLKKTNYQNCRIYNVHNKLLKKDMASKVKKIKGIKCYSSNIGNGFGNKAKKCVLDALKNNKTAVIYSHPWELRNPKVKKQFLDFLRWLK